MKTLGAFGCSLLFLASAAVGDEEKVQIKDLPAAVQKSVLDKFPNAKLETASKETEDGETMFEVAIVFKGAKIDVSSKSDGKLTEYEKEIAPSELPKAVSDAVKAKYPKGKFEKAEEIHEIEDGKDELESYEVQVAVDNKSVEVEVSPKGKILDDDEDDEDDDD